MANVAKIQAELDLDSGKFHGSITSALGQLNKFNVGVNKSDKNLEKMTRRITGLGASLRDTMVVLGQFRAAMHTLWTFTGQWVGAIIQANAKMERLQVLMKGLSKSSTEVGKVTDALRDMNYVLEKSKSVPFAVETIADSFVKLKASGIDPTKGSLDALTNAVARFGGNSETLHRATIAIQQMAGKGVVSMEEMRQQLGEAIPNAMQIMARSVNMSMSELVKTIASGKLAFDDVLQSKFFTEMNREFAGSAKNMMTTWVGMTQRLKTEWMIFAQEIGKGGLFESAKRSLQDLLAFMASGEGKAFAKEIGEALASAARAAGDLVRFLMRNREVIISWGKLLVQVFAVKTLINFGGALISTGVQVVGFARSLGTMSAAFAAAGTGAAGLSARISMLAGPIGIAVGAIGMLSLKLWENARASQNAQRAMTDYWNASRNGRVVAAGEFQDNLRKLDQLRQINAAMQQAYKDKSSSNQYTRTRAKNTLSTSLDQLREMGMLTDGGNGLADAFGMGSSWEEGFDALAQGMSELGPANLQQAALQGAERVNKIVDGYRASLVEKIAKVGPDINSALQENWRIINNGTPAEAEAAKKEMIRLREAKADAQITFLEQQKNRQGMLMATAGNEQAKQAVIREMRITDQELSRVLEEKANSRADPTMLSMTSDKDKAPKGPSPLETMLQQVAGRNAELQAQLDGGIPKLEKFNELLAMGKYGKNPDGGMVAGIRALLKANDDLAESIDKNRATEKLTEDLTEMEAKAKADVISASMKASGDLYSQVAAGMVGFNRQVEVMRANLDKTNMSAAEFEAAVARIGVELKKTDMIRFNKFAEDKIFDNYMATLPEKERRLAEFNETLRQYAILRANLKEGNPENAAQIDVNVDAMIASDQKRFRYENRNEWQKWIDDYSDITEEMETIWAGSLDSMAGGMTDFLTTGKMNWSDMATHILKEITRILVSKAIAQLAQYVIGIFGGGWGQGAGAGTTASSQAAIGSGSFVGPRAKGGAFNNGVEFFAKGGVVDGATGFSTKTGFGVMGEAGPEAIMPLARDGSGSLGVRMVGGDMAGAGGTQINNTVSIQVNITQDGEGSTSTESNSKAGKELGGMMEGKIKQVLTDEMRPGGLLWKMRTGG